MQFFFLLFFLSPPVTVAIYILVYKSLLVFLFKKFFIIANLQCSVNFYCWFWKLVQGILHGCRCPWGPGTRYLRVSAHLVSIPNLSPTTAPLLKSITWASFRLLLCLSLYMPPQSHRFNLRNISSSSSSLHFYCHYPSPSYHYSLPGFW